MKTNEQIMKIFRDPDTHPDFEPTLKELLEERQHSEALKYTFETGHLSKELLLLGLIEHFIKHETMDEFEVSRVVDYLADKHCGEYSASSLRCHLSSIKYIVDKANKT